MRDLLATIPSIFRCKLPSLDAWREAFSKLAKIEENQSGTGSDVTLGSGFSYETESDSEEMQGGEYVMAISCPCCGQDFTDRNRLVSHLEKVHHR